MLWKRDPPVTRTAIPVRSNFGPNSYVLKYLGLLAEIFGDI